MHSMRLCDFSSGSLEVRLFCLQFEQSDLERRTEAQLCLPIRAIKLERTSKRDGFDPSPLALAGLLDEARDALHIMPVMRKAGFRSVPQRD